MNIDDLQSKLDEMLAQSKRDSENVIQLQVHESQTVHLAVGIAIVNELRGIQRELVFLNSYIDRDQ